MCFWLLLEAAWKHRAHRCDMNTTWRKKVIVFLDAVAGGFLDFFSESQQWSFFHTSNQVFWAAVQLRASLQCHKRKKKKGTPLSASQFIDHTSILSLLGKNAFNALWQLPGGGGETLVKSIDCDAEREEGSVLSFLWLKSCYLNHGGYWGLVCSPAKPTLKQVCRILFVGKITLPRRSGPSSPLPGNRSTDYFNSFSAGEERLRYISLKQCWICSHVQCRVKLEIELTDFIFPQRTPEMHRHLHLALGHIILKTSPEHLFFRGFMIKTTNTIMFVCTEGVLEERTASHDSTLQEQNCFYHQMFSLWCGPTWHTCRV